MTPLARFYARFLPTGWVYPAVTFSYFLGALAFVLLAHNPAETIIYVDVRQMSQ
jgi:hypothetical protein